MKLQVYNPDTLLLEQDSATGIDFGTAYQGNPSDNLLLVKPAKTIESSFTQLELFLQNNGGLTQTEFRFLLQSSVTGAPSRNELSGGIFVLNESPALSDDGSAVFNAATPEFAWMDMVIGDQETSTNGNTNYRFVYEFN